MAQYQQWFEEFWDRNYYRLNISNPTRFHDNLSTKMATFRSTIDMGEFPVRQSLEETGLFQVMQKDRRIKELFRENIKTGVK